MRTRKQDDDEIRRDKTMQSQLPSDDVFFNSFYTPCNLAQYLVQYVIDTLPLPLNRYVFIEPAAGNGAFYNLLPSGQKIGIDIDSRLQTQHPDYLFHNFLSLDRETLRLTHIPQQQVVVIGNPPFGQGTDRKNV